MAAAKLWLLRVFAFQLITNAVEQLNIALLRVLLERGDEGPAHGTSSLTADGRIRPRVFVSLLTLLSSSAG